ncbi:MAG: hypothetical protein AAF191_06915 [Verrucomicrobiota bacterium]
MRPVSGSPAPSEDSPEGNEGAMVEVAKKRNQLFSKTPFPSYRSGPLPPEAKYLLVGGDSKVETLQSLLSLRELWISRGVTGEEISVYWIKPDEEEYRASRSAYRALSGATPSFYLASPLHVYRHLENVADHGHEEVYLHIISEGRAPGPVPLSSERHSVSVDHNEFSDQYRMMLAGGPVGRISESARWDSLKSGVPARDLLLTPRYLRAELEALPASMEKVVVLDGAHSGGFVETGTRGERSEVLRHLPNLTVFHSHRFDRGTADIRGAYTRIFVEELSQVESSGASISWITIANRVARNISELEAEAGVLEGEECFPGFETSSPRAMVVGNSP